MNRLRLGISDTKCGACPEGWLPWSRQESEARAIKVRSIYIVPAGVSFQVDSLVSVYNSVLPLRRT
jgi:hypothetical protein